MIISTTFNSMSRLARLVLLVRGSEGIRSSVDFYSKGVGLSVLRLTEEWAEMNLGNGTTLNLQAVSEESKLSVGYSPWIVIQVDNLMERIATCCQEGAHLDGPIQYPAHGSVAMLRTPDNHVIGLYQPKQH